MIRFRLRERIADLAFKSGERVTLEQIAHATGIHRVTLSKISSGRGYNTSTEIIDKLCRFFECTTGEIIEYVPDNGSSGA
jgi:putative transcriptional regulator